jgi:hypothetical protein
MLILAFAHCSHPKAWLIASQACASAKPGSSSIDFSNSGQAARLLSGDPVTNSRDAPAKLGDFGLDFELGHGSLAGALFSLLERAQGVTLGLPWKPKNISSAIAN